MITRTAILLAASMTTVPAIGADLIPMDTGQREALGIRVAALEPTSTVAGSRVPARIVIPPTQVRVVSAPQGGMVEQVAADVGSVVREGEHVVRIQSPDLVRLQRDFLQALSQQRLAASDLKRDKTLLDEGVIANRRYLSTRSRYEELTAALEQGRQSLLLAGMHQDEISRMTQSRRLSTGLDLHSPIEGVVLERMAEPGQRVEVADPIFRIARLAPLWLEARVSIDAVGAFAEGDSVRVPGGPTAGRVVMVGADVDPTSQTVLVRAELTDGLDAVRPGQYVEAVITAEHRSARYSVPAGAVAREGTRALVFVSVDGGFEPREVQLFGVHDGQAVVGDHFTGEEQVVVAGIAAIKGAWMGLGGGE